MSTHKHGKLRIGIDIGGTFTDFVVYEPGRSRLDTFKLLSTPAEPALAVINGIERIIQEYDSNQTERVSLNIIHGSTVATNALLERKGATTVLVTTAGFRDVLEIGRQNRAELYDLLANPPPPLVPRWRRFETTERVDSQGNVLVGLDEAELDKLVSEIKSQAGVQSIAVCLLFSFLHPEHESLIGTHLEREGYEVSLSSQVLPEFREYERTSTTVVNAYVTPIMKRYLAALDDQLDQLDIDCSLQIMQSNGGSISLGEAKRKAVHCILSGPAGGIIGGQFIGSQAFGGLDKPLKLITFDMGGTSTDVSLIDGKPQTSTETYISNIPIRVPVLDIHTIGAGGGSIAWVDQGGALRVGPQSAGADPGPACYGRGVLPTVTDANLILGRLDARNFLGGEMTLYYENAERAIKSLGAQLGLDAGSTASGIIEVVNANMERALRLISVERGHDPREYTVLSFGGAGGLHAAELARRIGSHQVLIPPYASTLSALGMLASKWVKDYSLTVMLSAKQELPYLERMFEPLFDQCLAELSDDGISREGIQFEQLFDLRYQGQSYELTIPAGRDYLSKFHAAHRANYGFDRPDGIVEIVTLRLVASRGEELIVLPQLLVSDGDATQAQSGYRNVFVLGKEETLPVYNGEKLLSGNQFDGPAIVTRKDTTIMAGHGDKCRIDHFGNLWIVNR